MAPGTSSRARKPPLHEALVRDLVTLRQKGIAHLRGLKLDALTSAANLASDLAVESTYLPQAIEDLLRRAVDRMDGGRFADSAELLFGLAQGTRGANPTDLRRDSADRLNISTETFRKDHEKTTVAELAEAILGLCRDHEMREARIEMMNTRHPADSRLAINWSERFEDYYRIWTPIYALAADLVAYRLTMIDPDRSWDLPDEPGRLIAPMSTETEGYTQEYQAEGYVRFAIYRYALYLQEQHRFMVKRGGLWLLSNAETEIKVRNALYQVELHSPNNERDDSWMRVTMSQSNGELHVFNDLMMRTNVGSATHLDWQEWTAQCACTWDTERSADDRGTYFATSQTDGGIDADCALHQVVAGCSAYLGMIDADWMAIADWYGDQIVRRPVTR